MPDTHACAIDRPLVHLVRFGTEEQRAKAAAALGNVGADDAYSEIIQEKGLEPLLDLASAATMNPFARWNRWERKAPVPESSTHAVAVLERMMKASRDVRAAVKCAAFSVCTAWLPTIDRMEIDELRLKLRWYETVDSLLLKPGYQSPH